MWRVALSMIIAGLVVVILVPFYSFNRKWRNQLSEEGINENSGKLVICTSTLNTLNQGK